MNARIISSPNRITRNNALPQTILVCFLFLVFCENNVFAKQEPRFFCQTPRDLPLAGEVDLLVVGGTIGSVAMATSAAEGGANVLLVTPYPYLGEDKTATLRLWPDANESMDDPLARRIFYDPDRRPRNDFNLDAYVQRRDKIAFTYTIKGEIDDRHPETNPLGRLTDGKLYFGKDESLQINGDAVIEADLGKTDAIGELTLFTFCQDGIAPFGVQGVDVLFSQDGTNWLPANCSYKKRTIYLSGTFTFGDILPFVFTFPEPVQARYVKLNVRKQADFPSMSLGELILLPHKDTSMEAFLDTVSQTTDPVAPRPMHIKRVLDATLLEAGVPFLYNTHAIRRLEDADGKPAGAVIANRSGLQAVIAKRVFVAREEDRHLDTVEFHVIGGTPKMQIDLSPYDLLESVKCEVIGEPFHGPKGEVIDDGGWSRPSPMSPTHPFPLLRYTFKTTLKDFATLPLSEQLALHAKLDTQIRLATYDPTQAFTADEFCAPSSAFRSIASWRQEGAAIAEQLKEQSPPKTPLSIITDGSYSSDINVVRGDVRQSLDGLRPGVEVPVNIPISETKYPVVAEYDVVIVGGGTSGVPAGIGAAKHGAKTIVLEQLYDLGGVGTAGAVSVYWHGNRVGFTGTVQEGARKWNIEQKIHWWRSHLHEAGADIWCGMTAVGAVVDESRVKGVLIATPRGPGIVLGKVIIDATGNGDVAAAAGAEMMYGHSDEIAIQGAGLPPRNLGGSYTNTDYMYIDETNAVDVSHVFVHAKEKYPTAFDQGKLLGTRERRRIVGEFVFNVLDQVNNRTYPDSIVYAFSDYDMHGFPVDPYLELYHPFPNKYFAYVPYRSSIPERIQGILVSGLATSCHRDALPIVRMQPDLQNQGYALGCAAAMAVGDNVDDLRKIDVRRLQKHLVDIGNLPPSVLNDMDNYEERRSRLKESVDKLASEYKERLPVVMWYPEDAEPLIHEAYLKATSPHAKLVYAKVAAALDDPIGVETLIESVASGSWDKDWDVRSSRTLGGANTVMDQRILMLGRTKDPRGIPAIVEKLDQLNHDSRFSHHRACLVALEMIGDPQAAEAVARHLSKPGMTGYVHDSLEKVKTLEREHGTGTIGARTRADSLLEITTARVLYRLSDVNGEGEAILRSYMNDLRGHFARHASIILHKNAP